MVKQCERLDNCMGGSYLFSYWKVVRESFSHPGGRASIKIQVSFLVFLTANTRAIFLSRSLNLDLKEAEELADPGSAVNGGQ